MKNYLFFADNNILNIMERVSTGVNDLDEMLSGGYPKGKGVVVTGETGTGKTILGLHFVYKGCSEGRKCIYFATEESPEDLFNQAESLGMNLKKYYETGQFQIVGLYEERAYLAETAVQMGLLDAGLHTNIIGLSDKISENTDILVIDNLGVFTLNMSLNEFRAQFDALNRRLAKRNVTALYILDEPSNRKIEDIAAYSVSSVIRLYIRLESESRTRKRYLEISKMRNTKIPLELFMFEISAKGLVLLEKKEMT